MTPEQYHTFIKKLQELEFPGVFSIDECVKENKSKYSFFSPSHHFHPSMPLMTEEIVSDLRDNKKRLLSIGCGPAYLERLLIARLRIKPEQITLADISEDFSQPEFEFYNFDMHKDWPNMNKTFDYIIFPESPAINMHFSGADYGDDEIRQPDREKGLFKLLVRSLKVLNSLGQARLTCGVTDLVRKPVKKQIESEFPNVKMDYSRELTYIIKN